MLCHCNGSKVKSVGELSHLVADLKSRGTSVVQCHGVFDLLHPGHIRHLEAAKRQGDVLLVTVTRDDHVGKGPGRPVFAQDLRVECLAALTCVDYVAVNEWPTAVEAIRTLRPDVYAKGSDYSDATNDLTGRIGDEEEAVQSVGGRIHFTDEITFSSTTLLNNHFDVIPEEARLFLGLFRERYSSSDVIGLLQSLKKTKVLVIGDTIIDEYHYCTPLGKAPKEYLIPARYLYEEAFAGGTLAMANHLAGFCDEVDLVSCLGLADTREEFIREHLKPNVRAEFFYRPDAPTVIKRRFVEPDLLRKMFEVCFLGDNELPEPVNRELCTYLMSHVADYHLVLAADYGHGFLGPLAIETLCDKARFLAVNVQTNSANIGFNLVTKYKRAHYVCVDEPEIRLATHDHVGELETLLASVADQLRCAHAVVTRGHLGSLVYGAGNGFCHAPVFSREAIDRTGAGDAYFSITAPCAAAGFPSELIGLVGNAAGALAIRIVGNRSSVEPVPLFRYITTLLK